MSSIFDKMLQGHGISKQDFEIQRQRSMEAGKPTFLPKRGVEDSAELKRILALPRRDWRSVADKYADALTGIFRQPQGQQKLRPPQVASLVEMHDCHGLFAPLQVGSGKSLIAYLASVMLECERPMLVIPAKLVEKTRREMHEYRKHWTIPGYINIQTYELLGRPQAAQIIDSFKPDLIICDEVHRLKNTGAAVTKRIKRYLEQHQDTKFVGLSGTIMKRSIKDYAHIVSWALKSTNPTPRDFNTREEWAAVLDEKPNRKGEDFDLNKFAPGALIQLCNDEERKIYEEDPVKAVRMAYGRRVRDTPGVISSGAEDLGVSLSIRSEVLPMPEISQAVRDMRLSWMRPDGEPIMDAIELWRHMLEIACGFYYRWNPMPPVEWRTARKTYAQSVRKILKHNQRHLDSESQVRRAIIEGHYPEHTESLRQWQIIAPTFKPQTEAVWLSDRMLKRTAKWMKEEKGLVWVQHVEFGLELAKNTGVAFYQRGGVNQWGKPIEDHKPGTPMILSIASNSEGRNLQAWSDNLFTYFPTSGAQAEQCLDSVTEILTERGWTKIDDEWPEGLRVAAYRIEDGSVAWEPGQRIQRVLGLEQMYGIQNPHLDIRVTAGHRMIVQRYRRFGPNGTHGSGYRERQFVRADSMPQRVRIPLAGVQDAEGVPLSDDELTLIGLFLSDGNLNKESVSFFQSERYPEVMALHLQLFASLGLPFKHSVTTSPTNFGERKHPLHRWALNKATTRPYLPWLDKSLDNPEWENLTRQQLISLLFGLWAGDGSKTVGTYSYDRYDPHTWNIVTGRADLAHRLQSLCVRKGVRCNIVQQRENMWMLHLSDQQDTWTVVNLPVGDGRPKWARLPSDPFELVWCAQIPSGAIITRRNGKVAVVGNCLGRSHRSGQQADEVNALLLVSLREQAESFERARNDARAISDMTRQPQKLTYADVDVISPRDAPSGLD